MNGLSPWTMGQMSPAIQAALYKQVQPGTPGAIALPGGLLVIPHDLTGENPSRLSLIIYNSAQSQIATGAGSWSIIQYYPAVVQYAWAAADSTTAISSTPGQYYWKIKVNFSGTAPWYTFFQPWTITN